MLFMTNTLPCSIEEPANIDEKREPPPSEPDNFNLTLLDGGFSLLIFKTGFLDRPGTLVIFLGDPDGEIIRDAKIITTIIDQNGIQQMRGAQPLAGGYGVKTAHLRPGQYRLEVEIVTYGWLLTDEFCFQVTEEFQ
jgi:hypothetical protein